MFFFSKFVFMFCYKVYIIVTLAVHFIVCTITCSRVLKGRFPFIVVSLFIYLFIFWWKRFVLLETWWFPVDQCMSSQVSLLQLGNFSQGPPLFISKYQHVRHVLCVKINSDQCRNSECQWRAQVYCIVHQLMLVLPVLRIK